MGTSHNLISSARTNTGPPRTAGTRPHRCVRKLLLRLSPSGFVEDESVARNRRPLGPRKIFNRARKGAIADGMSARRHLVNSLCCVVPARAPMG